MIILPFSSADSFSFLLQKDDDGDDEFILWWMDCDGLHGSFHLWFEGSQDLFQG